MDRGRSKTIWNKNKRTSDKDERERNRKAGRGREKLQELVKYTKKF